MDCYQFKFLKNSLLDKFLSIIKNPYKVYLYYNTYVKNKLIKFEYKNLIVSYPKSGRTWIHEILKLYAFKMYSDNNEYLQGLIHINKNTIKFDHDCSDWVPYPKKVLHIKNKKSFNGKTIILIRDPREIIVSSWYHLTFREKINTKKISDFIDDDYLGISKIINFYNLINEKLINNSIVIGYESLCKNTLAEVVKILKYFKIEINQKIISECISECSFKNLQKKEISKNKVDNQNSLKFRKGKIGNFHEDLNEQDLKKINNYIALNLNRNFKKILKLEDI